jgi:tRNA A37 threonylcarbamoyladenosine modification protein TsaB
MKILIEIREKKIRLALLQKGKEVDFLDIIEDHVLSEKLLPEIDRLLKKNKLKSEEIKRILVKSDQGDNFTTTRIAKTVANTWNWESGS